MLNKLVSVIGNYILKLEMGFKFAHLIQGMSIIRFVTIFLTL